MKYFDPTIHGLVVTTVLTGWQFEAKMTTRLSFHLTAVTLFDEPYL